MMYLAFLPPLPPPPPPPLKKFLDRAEKWSLEVNPLPDRSIKILCIPKGILKRSLEEWSKHPEAEKCTCVRSSLNIVVMPMNYPPQVRHNGITFIIDNQDWSYAGCTEMKKEMRVGFLLISILSMCNEFLG